MKKHKVIVWGASGHAKVVADILRLNGHEIAGFIDDLTPTRIGEQFCGALVVGDRKTLGQMRKQGVTHAIIAFGDNHGRLRAGEICVHEGLSLLTAIHPKAIIAADVEIGDGTVVAAGVVVNSGTRIGNSVIVNTNASLDHDCILADGAHIGPGVNLAGAVSVESCVWIGIGASVSDHCCIGKNSIVGAGAVVLDDILANTVVAGVPAKFLRSVDAQENR